MMIEDMKAYISRLILANDSDEKALRPKLKFSGFSCCDTQLATWPRRVAEHVSCYSQLHHKKASHLSHFCHLLPFMLCCPPF